MKIKFCILFIKEEVPKQEDVVEEKEPVIEVHHQFEQEQIVQESSLLSINEGEG